MAKKVCVFSEDQVNAVEGSQLNTYAHKDRDTSSGQGQNDCKLAKFTAKSGCPKILHGNANIWIIPLERSQ